MPDIRKTIVTCILLVIIDRVEFAYTRFEGWDVFVPFMYFAQPMQLSWYVYNLSIYIQHLLWVIILYQWLPFKNVFIWVVAAFGLIIVEFPITYGRPIARFDIAFLDWYLPISCSLLRLVSILVYFAYFVKKAFEK